MRFANALLLLALAAPARAQDAAPELDAQLAELRQLTELDLSQRIVERFGTATKQAGLRASGEALALIARARFAIGDEAGALALLERDDLPATDLTTIAIERARLLIETDRLNQALQLLTVEREGRRQPRFPDAAKAWLLLARTQVRRGSQAGVEDACRRFLELAPFDPGAPSAWHILAGHALQRRDADKAREYFERAEASRLWHQVLRVRRMQVYEHPDDPLPRLGLALVWMEAEAFERARTILRELTTSAPTFCRAFFHLAEAERALDARTGAAEAYDRALACDPEHAPARWNRALFRLANGDVAAARTDLEALIAGPVGSEPAYAAAHLELARLLSTANEPEAAQKRYARYRELGGTEALEER